MDERHRQPRDVYGCPFCRIADGATADVLLVGEASDWLAFFPPEPATRGHTLIVPRRHVSNFLELECALAAKLTHAASRIGRAICHALEPEGLNLITSAGTAAEQTVCHMHWHVVPRWAEDAFGDIWAKPGETKPATDLYDAADRIRRAFDAQ